MRKVALANWLDHRGVAHALPQGFRGSFLQTSVKQDMTMPGPDDVVHGTLQLVAEAPGLAACSTHFAAWSNEDSRLVFWCCDEEPATKEDRKVLHRLRGVQMNEGALAVLCNGSVTSYGKKDYGGGYMHRLEEVIAIQATSMASALLIDKGEVYTWDHQWNIPSNSIKIH